ncbi:MAG: hypothetical protein LBD74_06880 [Spirochaetaceae bacterium]|jgi:hypothetical protein|nr:hypothetical protein [Spirochaetaceae bacterium]
MEELQSTERLDREILEDAHKKAARILKAADEAIQAGICAWEEKTNVAIAGIRQNYDRTFESVQREFHARVILDKRRIRAGKIEALLTEALDAYFLSLPRTRLLSLLAGTLQGCVAEVTKTGEMPRDFSVQCCGLTDTEGVALLRAAFPLGSWTMTPLAEQPGPENPFPVIQADAPSVRITVSIRGLGETLLAEKRAELVEALVGAEVLETLDSAEAGGVL